MSEIQYIASKINKKYVTSFKQMGNNPISLTKSKYIDDVLPNIKDYYLTDKADGLRCFLLINKNNIKYLTSQGINYMHIENIFNEEYIFDCELVNNILYIFDVIIFNNINVASETFSTRYLHLLEFEKILNQKNINLICIKSFYKLEIKNYQKKILELYKFNQNKNAYKIDGLIFIESNKDYNNTLNLKWKPAEYLTIDFLAVKIKPNEYILVNGISIDILHKFGIKLNKNFTDLIKSLPINIKEKYVPTPFYNSLKPNIYYYTHNDQNEDLHGNIIELSLDKNINWVFHRIRHDRNVELQNGSYYGNNYKVAETTLASIFNPLSIKDITMPYIKLVNEIYFKKQDVDYKNVKHFNNYIKNLLIKRYKNTSSVIDLASGRGGDLNKYANNNNHNVLMLEIDNNAIEEVINRKYNILPKSNNSDGCNLIVLQINLNDNYTKNIEIIDKSFVNSDIYVNNLPIINKNSTNVIFCHFAMHYLLNSEKSAENIISFISHYLANNGEFVISIFNGQKVFDLLKSNNGKWASNSKYMIKYKGKQPSVFSGFNHKIDILLPLSDKPYEEPLIDLYALDKIFKKNHMYRKEEKNFEDMYQEYISYNSKYIDINSDDKIFIGLYKYVIYKKTK